MARILIVNDEVDLLTLCRKTLADAGHDADIATSGKDALERARRLEPDLIVADWVIPDMDGSAFIASLKGRPDTKDIPILAMSALHDGAVRAEMAGADHFLPKPFETDDLVDAVNTVLTRSTAHQSRAR
jgi:DNA-binding response OmpR family regulator